MSRRAIALAAAALLGFGVVGVGAARVGGFLSHAGGHGPAVTQTAPASSAGSGLATQSGATGDGGAQGSGAQGGD